MIIVNISIKTKQNCETFLLYCVQHMVFGSSSMFDFLVLLIKKWVTLLNIIMFLFAGIGEHYSFTFPWACFLTGVVAISHVTTFRSDSISEVCIMCLETSIMKSHPKLSLISAGCLLNEIVFQFFWYSILKSCS